MSTNGVSSGWLLLLARLPGSPSSARVALWRRLRAIGATSVVNSVWVLPATSTHAQFFEQVRETLAEQGGSAIILTVPACPPEVDESIRQHFQADRAREYEEFAERCGALLEEIGKEARAGKYTFAEMEESEQDLEKLTRWLAKIQARDFFPDDHRQSAAAMMARCRSAIGGFSHAVYIAEGVEEPPGSADTSPPNVPDAGATTEPSPAQARVTGPGTGPGAAASAEHRRPGPRATRQCR